MGELKTWRGKDGLFYYQRGKSGEPEAVSNWRNGCAGCGYLKEEIHAIQDEGDAFRYAVEHMVSFEGKIYCPDCARRELGKARERENWRILGVQMQLKKEKESLERKLRKLEFENPGK